MQKRAFTLVELLIVIVIIGILSTAILPKITGYMAKTRDLKRIMDLQALATAVESYKTNKGYFPFFKEKMLYGNEYIGNFFRKASDLKEVLQDYLVNIPQDPQKNNLIKICIPRHDHYCNNKWEYLYVLQLERSHLWWDLAFGKPIALLLAKVETADRANYILLPKEQQPIENGFIKRRCYWCLWRIYHSNGIKIYPSRWFQNFKLCSQVSKWEEAKRELSWDWSYHCTYNNSDQLYYVLKLE